GGQMLNRGFLNGESWISQGFVILSAGFLCSGALKYPFFPLLIFTTMILLRLLSDSKIDAVEKKFEMMGIDLDRSYEELPDKDYWTIRNILVEEHPAFKDIPPTPPYEYSHKEEKIMTIIQSLMHRHLIQDV